MVITSHPRKVIIVGAGFYGIVAAKTYLQINPAAEITIIDKEDGIGGVWAAPRIYPGLTYEQPTPMLDFTDFDMCKELGKEMWEDVSGEEVNAFLVKYAEKHDIIKLCRLQTDVINIERHGLGWQVSVRPANNPAARPETLTCAKLIMATGITSKPKIPNLDLSKFNGIHFHAKEMGKRHQELLTPDIKNVVIIGGHKSALEAVGTCAQAGKHVEWLVREEGGGPTWMMPAKNPKGEPTAKMSTVRCMAALSPSVYRKSHFLDRFLNSQKWWLGTWLLNCFWRFMTGMIKGDRYTKSANMKRLEPHLENFFWFVPGGTILHDRDLETLRLIDQGNLIHVSRTTLQSAQNRTITLSNGTTLPCDALILCTGWELALSPLFSPSLASTLGLPVPPTIPSPSDKKHWSSLLSFADDRLLSRYPQLASPPPSIHIPTHNNLTPYLLYRGMVPSLLSSRGDNSIIILGNWANGRVQVTAELTSLWGVAYLENLMPPSTAATLRDKEKMDKDIATVEVFWRRRYLNAFLFRISIFESPEFDDVVLGDLGVRADRKRFEGERRGEGGLGWGVRSWWREWFGRYEAGDYRGVVEEFLEGVERRDGK